MTITAVFESLEEMQEFAGKLNGGSIQGAVQEFIKGKIYTGHPKPDRNHACRMKYQKTEKRLRMPMNPWNQRQNRRMRDQDIPWYRSGRSCQSCRRQGSVQRYRN